MSLPRRTFACVLLATGVTLAAAEWRLPPLTGDLAGKLESPLLTGAPALDWKLSLVPATGSQRRIELAVDAEGARVRAHVVIDGATRDGEWRIDAAEFAADVWWRVAAAKIPGDFAAASVSGKISVAGGGAFRAGVPTGGLTLALADGHLTLAKPAVELADIEVRIEFPVLPNLTASGTLTLAEAHVAGIPLRAGKLLFAFEPPGAVSVTAGTVSGLGGTIEVSPFRVVLANPVVAIAAKLHGLLLNEIAAFLPQALAEAAGRVDGEMALEWSAAQGVKFGDGWLRLAEGTPASVRLAPVPGLITGQLPPNNPAHAALSRVELGRTLISLRLLHAEFHPAGDSTGRSATLKLEGEPLDKELIAPLSIDVNVAGPLDQLVKLGLDDRMKMRGAP